MFADLLKAAFPKIEKSAPTLADAIASTSTEVKASLAISLLSSKFDVGPFNIEDLSHAIINDPYAEDKLSQLEEMFQHWFQPAA